MRRICRVEFSAITDIQPERDSAGYFVEDNFQFGPDLRHNKYSDGPFYRFRVAQSSTSAGVYALTVGEPPSRVEDKAPSGGNPGRRDSGRDDRRRRRPADEHESSLPVRTTMIGAVSHTAEGVFRLRGLDASGGGVHRRQYSYASQPLKLRQSDAAELWGITAYTKLN